MTSGRICLIATGITSNVKQWNFKGVNIENSLEVLHRTLVDRVVRNMKVGLKIYIPKKNVETAYPKELIHAAIYT